MILNISSVIVLLAICAIFLFISAKNFEDHGPEYSGMEALFVISFVAMSMLVTLMFGIIFPITLENYSGIFSFLFLFLMITISASPLLQSGFGYCFEDRILLVISFSPISAIVIELLIKQAIREKPFFLLTLFQWVVAMAIVLSLAHLYRRKKQKRYA
ncbi:hypothetical protein C0583_06555 [Candidatus Parcubacteria bacterium]|nr:MAG: hypothetical protein C0583_06555 [Candidatus Parcubacteria bacterium]